DQESQTIGTCHDYPGHQCHSQRLFLLFYGTLSTGRLSQETFMTTGGGFKAIKSVLRYTAQIGPLRLWQAVNSRNACKACAFGTGGQRGGYHNETGRGLEI